MAKLDGDQGGGHWYTAEGKAMHKVPLASGQGYRRTNITDARKMGLIPSPTSILGVQAKPGLDKWAKEQVGISAFTNPPVDGEDDKAYAKRMINLSYQQTSAAAEFGTEFHLLLENVLNGEPCPDDWKIHVDPILKWKADKSLQFVEREKIVLNLTEGYAGTMDVAARGGGGEKMVVDWKTRKTFKGYPVKAYEGQILQIAAYAAAYWGEGPVRNGEVYGVNAYISSTEAGRFERIGYTPEEIRRAYEVFLNLCAVWRWMKDYDPRRT